MRKMAVAAFIAFVPLAIKCQRADGFQIGRSRFATTGSGPRRRRAGWRPSRPNPAYAVATLPSTVPGRHCHRPSRSDPRRSAVQAGPDRADPGVIGRLAHQRIGLPGIVTEQELERLPRRKRLVEQLDLQALVGWASMRPIIARSPPLAAARPVDRGPLAERPPGPWLQPVEIGASSKPRRPVHGIAFAGTVHPGIGAGFEQRIKRRRISARHRPAKRSHADPVERRRPHRPEADYVARVPRTRRFVQRPRRSRERPRGRCDR
jgi:hypothetical protein